MDNEDFGIFPPYEVLYLESMLFITESAAQSLESAAIELEKFAANAPDFDQNGTLNHLQNIIIQGAALSRYFWPVRKGHEKRANTLRRSLSVTDSSPLKSRDLRNAIEHFDEKLDLYLATGITGHIIPHYIGPYCEINGVPSHLFRAYYCDRGVFEVLGNRFEMEPLVAEMGRIHDALTQSRYSGGRLPRAPQS